MTFDKAVVAQPTEIADISVELYDGDGKKAHYSVQVLYDNGEIKVLTGDLVPHLTQGQIDGLMDFMDDMRTKAEQEIL